MTETTCPIWGTPARDLPTSRDARDVFSPRAGGRYLIVGSAEGNLSGLNQREKALLTTWIVDQHRGGEECPEIDSRVLEAVRLRSLLRLSVRIERLFEFLSKKLYFVGQEIPIWPKIAMSAPAGTVYHSGQQPDDVEVIRQKLSAWLECINENEIKAIVSLLIEQGLLKDDVTKLALTAKGYERLEEIEQRSVPSVRCFVAMWFAASMDDAYEYGIKLAIEDTGYEPVRIDRKEHVNKIDDEIIAEIRRAKFLVADFTCDVVMEGGRANAVPRGGVYYEAGFAQGLGIPVVWCCRSDCIEHVHFDTRQFAHIVWNDPADLRKRLRDRIAAVIGENPNKKVA